MIRIQNDYVPKRAGQIFVGVVTVFAGLGMLVFAGLGLLDPGAMLPGGDAEAASVFAGYMAARNVVLGGAALVLLALRAWRPLSLVLVLNGLVQVLDMVLGAFRGELLETVSPAIIAVALFAAVAAIRRSPIVQPASVPTGFVGAAPSARS